MVGPTALGTLATVAEDGGVPGVPTRRAGGREPATWRQGSVGWLTDLIQTCGDAMTAIPLVIAFASHSVRVEWVAGLVAVAPFSFVSLSPSTRWLKG